jgi:hypothetical protein
MALTKFRIPSDLEVSGSSYLTGSLNVKGVISGSDAVSASFFTSSQVGGFKGDGSALTGLTASNISNFSRDVIGQFKNGTNITIASDGTINAAATSVGTIRGSLSQGTNISYDSSTGVISTVNNPSFSGDVTVGGNLYVNGDTTELKVSELRIEDKLISVASASAYANGYNDGAGIEFGNQAGAPTFKYNSGSNQLSASVPLYIKGDITASSHISSSDGFVGDGSKLTNVTASILSVGIDGRGTWRQTTAQTVVSFSTGSHAAGKFAMVFEENLTGKRQVSEFFVGHSGSSAFITQYNDIYMSANQDRLVTLNVASAVGAAGVINVTASRDASQTFLTGNYIVSKLYMVKPV